ncbi:protein transporter Sec31 [Streptomyces atratus]|uniref:protein transporter Sec31 n=1 Tax=Streptomyces atratus TaxID=1893 RepID=UPI003651CA70
MRTRTVKRSELVPHTVDGKTSMVLDRYEVEVPLPPRDWDRIVLTAVTALAAGMVTASVVWSTASIGALLALTVFTAAAYSAAAVFDLLWIMCMALEWLARYDTRRAKLPRRAGHVALLVAMAAVAVHGWIADQAVIGCIGAAVSGIAKTGWTVVLKHHAKPLDNRTQQWVDIQRAEAGGQLAMVAVRRELQRTQAAVAAEAQALGLGSGSESGSGPDSPDESADDPDHEKPVPPDGPMTVRDAVRTALDSGIHEEDAVLRYVRKVADANARPDTVGRYLRSLRRTA